MEDSRCVGVPAHRIPIWWAPMPALPGAEPRRFHQALQKWIELLACALFWVILYRIGSYSFPDRTFVSRRILGYRRLDPAFVLSGLAAALVRSDGHAPSERRCAMTRIVGVGLLAVAADFLTAARRQNGGPAMSPLLRKRQVIALFLMCQYISQLIKQT